MVVIKALLLSQTLSVSDHYPVEVELKQKAVRKRKRKAPPAKGQTHKKGNVCFIDINAFLDIVFFYV